MMTPETEALVTALHAAYRDALLVQAERDAALKQHQDKDKATREAWSEVYRLQQQLQLMGGSE